MNSGLDVTSPGEVLQPVAVKKAQSTGTKELRGIERSLDTIVDLCSEVRDKVLRKEDKATHISGALLELCETIRETGEITPEIKEILEDLDARVFEERVFTEKCGRGVIRMTDATAYKLMAEIADKAAKVASTKHRMSSGDYTPTATVVAKLQQTLDAVSSVLKEHLGPIGAGPVVDELLGHLVELWNE